MTAVITAAMTAAVMAAALSAVSALMIMVTAAYIGMIVECSGKKRLNSIIRIAVDTAVK